MSGAPGLFRVLRGVYVAGVAYQPGALLKLDDAALIATLVETGKVEPADDATRARLRSSAAIAWRAVSPRELDEPRDDPRWRRVYP